MNRSNRLLVLLPCGLAILAIVVAGILPWGWTELDTNSTDDVEPPSEVNLGEIPIGQYTTVYVPLRNNTDRHITVLDLGPTGGLNACVGLIHNEEGKWIIKPGQDLQFPCEVYVLEPGAFTIPASLFSTMAVYKNYKSF